jgi:hypothetical protein
MPLPELVQFLSRDVTMEQARALDGVRVLSDPDDGSPYLVIVEPQEALRVSDLKALFGEPRRGRSHPEQPHQLIFDTPEIADAPWHVVVTAQSSDGERVSRIALRRDRM